MDIKEKNASAKSECEFLVGVLLPLAEKYIRKHGEFYPFGAVLLNNDTKPTSTINFYNSTTKICFCQSNCRF